MADDVIYVDESEPWPTGTTDVTTFDEDYDGTLDITVSANMSVSVRRSPFLIGGDGYVENLIGSPYSYAHTRNPTLQVEFQGNGSASVNVEYTFSYDVNISIYERTSETVPKLGLSPWETNAIAVKAALAQAAVDACQARKDELNADPNVVSVYGYPGVVKEDAGLRTFPKTRHKIVCHVNGSIYYEELSDWYLWDTFIPLGWEVLPKPIAWDGFTEETAHDFSVEYYITYTLSGDPNPHYETHTLYASSSDARIVPDSVLVEEQIYEDARYDLFGPIPEIPADVASDSAYLEHTYTVPNADITITRTRTVVYDTPPPDGEQMKVVEVWTRKLTGAVVPGSVSGTYGSLSYQKQPPTPSPLITMDDIDVDYSRLGVTVGWQFNYSGSGIKIPGTLSIDWPNPVLSGQLSYSKTTYIRRSQSLTARAHGGTLFVSTPGKFLMRPGLTKAFEERTAPFSTKHDFVVLESGVLLAENVNGEKKVSLDDGQTWESIA